jgi:hypothetical protein
MEVEAKAKVRFMGEIVTPRRPCSTWNERRVVSLQRGMESSSGQLPPGEILPADLAHQLKPCQHKNHSPTLPARAAREASPKE